MRVLLVDQFGEMGGAQRCLVEAASGFFARGWELRALVPSRVEAGKQPAAGWQPAPLGVALRPYCDSVREVACGPFASGSKTVTDGLRFARQLPGLALAIARTPADVIYVNGPRVLPAAALGRAGRPLIYHVHWMVPQRSAASLARVALRRSGASVIATSRAAAAWLKGCVEPHRISTIYNGVAGFGLAPKPRDIVRHVAVLGRVSPEKGQGEFVRAARSIAAHLPDVRFTICGAPMFAEDGYFQQVREEAAGLPIEFRGWTEDTGSFLAGVDLLVVPSSAIDNIPRVILEAFAAGVPVVAFASGAIPELIEDRETGFLIRERTAEALAQTIVSIAGNRQELNRISVRASRRWQERYTLVRYQSEICAAVEAASRRHHQRTPLASAGANAPA